MMVSDGKNDLLCVGGNKDVVSCELECYERWKNQPMDIVSDLVGLGTEAKCEAIFNYLITNTEYLLDEAGKQWIKSPARLLHDGCGDCKSLTMFIVCCLHCLNVPHIIRFVNFDGGSTYSHVYAVAIDEMGREIILDACEKDEDGNIFYNYARPYKKKKDFRFNG